MKTVTYYIFVLCAASGIYSAPVIIHDKNIDAPGAHFIPLSETFSIIPPRMTYIPQQLIVVRNCAKRFPITAYPLCKRASYIKCTIQPPKQDIELFIRKEKMNHKLKEQLTLEGKNFKHNKNTIMRFYRKINQTWQPIISMPEDVLFSPHSRIIIQPDGRLQIRSHS